MPPGMPDLSKLLGDPEQMNNMMKSVQQMMGGGNGPDLSKMMSQLGGLMGPPPAQPKPQS